MDEKLKQDILLNCPELLKAQSLANKYLCFKAKNIAINEKFELAYQEANSFLCQFSTEALQTASQINTNRFQRLKRLRQRITEYMVVSDIARDCHLYFVTLSFNDGVLEKTSEKTRRRYVVRFLGDISMSFVGNIDYGEKNGREHYHAVIITNHRLEYSHMQKEWCKVLNDTENTNSIKFEQIIKSEASKTKLSKYLAKLTNHAFKECTKAYCIYSRQNKGILNDYVRMCKGQEPLLKPKFIDCTECAELPF